VAESGQQDCRQADKRKCRCCHRRTRMKSREGRSRVMWSAVREKRRGTVSGRQVAVTFDRQVRHILALTGRRAAYRRAPSRGCVQ
jgi:hypothetical protein